MQLNEHNVMSNLSDLTQLLLWSDDEMPEVQQPTQDGDRDVQEEASFLAQGESPATQLYLPGFEPE
jgi:hypothetical protein